MYLKFQNQIEDGIEKLIPNVSLIEKNTNNILERILYCLKRMR